MKVMTILGTRPEIIRLALIIPRLDELCDQVLVNTGQNYDDNLSGVFFQQLGVRRPDHELNARGTFGEQIGTILTGIERLMLEVKPDRFLVLGDTNSSLAAIMAKRLGIPVYHMEAGNRSYDDRVPEEVNRRLIDHASTILLPYTERSRQNLLREGIPGDRIFVTGNPIYEVLTHFEPQIAASDVHAKLGLPPGEYFLVTLHRAETVDVDDRLAAAVDGMTQVGSKYDQPVLWSLHPHTRKRLQGLGIDPEAIDGVRCVEPLGLFEFIALEKAARCVLTDSGTVQEECSIFRVPSVTLRDVTERPETIEAGSNMLAGVRADAIVRSVEVALSAKPDWQPPAGYLDLDVTTTVVKIVLSGAGPRA
jgi:UDP-N-acetylglucosamine 2-epimerase (non-hydrolysing)